MNKIIITILLSSIFTVSCDLQPKRFEASIPKDETAQTDLAVKNPKYPIIIQVSSEGKVSLNGANYGSVDDLTLFQKEVSKLLELNQKEPVENTMGALVKAKKSVKYQYVVLVIDKVKELGATPVGLQLDDK